MALAAGWPLARWSRPGRRGRSLGGRAWRLRGFAASAGLAASVGSPACVGACGAQAATRPKAAALPVTAASRRKPAPGQGAAAAPSGLGVHIVAAHQSSSCRASRDCGSVPYWTYGVRSVDVWGQVAPRLGGLEAGAAARKTVASACHLPTIWSPTGKPSDVKPHGTWRPAGRQVERVREGADGRTSAARLPADRLRSLVRPGSCDHAPTGICGRQQQVERPRTSAGPRW